MIARRILESYPFWLAMLVGVSLILCGRAGVFA